jgi:hypothetical protein
MFEQLVSVDNAWFYIGGIGFILSVMLFIPLMAMKTEDKRVEDLFILLLVPFMIGFLVLAGLNAY